MSTTSDLALLRRKLAASDYVASVYVSELAGRCVGGHELVLHKKNIAALADDTHSQLKKNVYKNYGQFIETAREISCLESEMYQLSHMITEQRNILLKLSEMSLLGDKAPELAASGGDGASANAEDDGQKKKGENTKQPRSDFESGRRRLYDLLEKVEGCSHVTDVPSRFLLYDGPLVEIDADQGTALHRVHGYLLNDGFMVATWLPNVRGPVRFRFSCLYELDSLAIVNVRDGGINNSFKLLHFPDTRLFQCPNAQAKLEWMDAFEDSKKRRQKEQESQALKRSDTISTRERNRLKQASIRRHLQIHQKRKSNFLKNKAQEFPMEKIVDSLTNNSTSKNPFDEDFYEDDEVEAISSPHGSKEDKKEDFELPEWLTELSDDLEVHVAQREFEAAVDLVFKAKDFCLEHADKPLVREAAKRLEKRKNHLLEVLKIELGTEKSVQGGPRAARRAVQLLVRLGRSAEAAVLFLKHRAAILHTAMKGVKLDSATVPYVQRLTLCFFNNVQETALEFDKAFQALPGKKSSLLTWLSVQLDDFGGRIERQIFSPSTPLEIIAACVHFVRQESLQLRENGLDVTYYIDTRFRSNVERTINEHRDKHVEAVKLRAQEDKWEPINCFNVSGTERFMDEMTSAGIPSVRAYVYDDCWVALTRNTTSFSLSYLSFADSLLKLFNPSLRSLINESLVTVFHSHLRHIEQAIRSEKLKNIDPKFVQKNAAFLLDTLLSLIEHKYQECTKADCPKLGKLHASYTWLKEGQLALTASSVKGSTSKYLDPNYV